jgi:ATP-binding cassette subfamily C exporter for protease/lipase
MIKQLFDTQHDLGKALRRVRPYLWQAALFSFAINMLALVPSLYMLQVYDRVLGSRNVMTLALLTLLLLVLYAAYGVLEDVRTRMLVRVGVQLHDDLSDRVFVAAFDRFLRRQGGNPMLAVSDLTATRQFLAGAGALAFFDAPWAPVYLLVITLLHPWLGLFALVSIALLVGLTWVNEVATHQPLVAANREAAAAQTYATNSFRNSEAILALGMFQYVRARWTAYQCKIVSMQSSTSEIGGSIGAVGKAVRLTTQSCILGLGAWLAINDQVTPGGMIAASILLGRALAPVEQLIAAWKHWVVVEESATRLIELLQAVPVRAPTVELPDPVGHLQLENVSAVPPGGTVPTLRGLNLSMSPGDVVAVIGPSAAGKSTLARLLVGVWPAAQGTVRLDGANIYTWDKDHLGQHVGYLPQDHGLIEGTVAENVGRFGPADSAAVVAAAKLAGAHEMILQLPQGYETPVGIDGALLSGGQRQRIALARALLGNPKLVVLDEPNSNLDDAGISALLKAIETLRQRGALVVVIAHSPQLLPVATKLLALRDGALVVYGPRDKALAHLGLIPVTDEQKVKL